MSSHAAPPERVPTLTEVVHWPGAPAPAFTAPSGPNSNPNPNNPNPNPNPLSPAMPRPALATMGGVPRRLDPPTPSPQPATDTAPTPVPVPARTPATAATAPAAAALPVADELLTQQVYADLQRQVELMLEYRLRETLAPLLTRAADSIVRDARNELASTLRDVVARAVAQELARHRPR